MADYVEKVVGNLLSNAVKFTPEGGRVSLRLHHRGERLLMEVSDTGCGISAQDLPHIYEPFYRADGQDGMGSGVGLALVKQIVDSLGGQITVESEENEGTTFRVEMPAASARPTSSTPEIGDVPSLLIVEDNADVARLIEMQLKDRYAISVAKDGEEGIAKARELMPDLIITDLMMPGTDGLQLCRNIRSDEATNHIPIIVVTAKATEADRIKGLEAGADAYLYKPFNAEELSVRVEKLLQQRLMLRKKYSMAAGEDNDATDVVEHEHPSFATNSDDFAARLNAIVLSLIDKGTCDVENVASEMCMSSSTLRRKVNAVMGMSPKRYILNVRLEKAHKMLSATPRPTLSEVAEQLGFYDLSHFLKTYRSFYGMSPSEELTQTSSEADHA